MARPERQAKNDAKFRLATAYEDENKPTTTTQSRTQSASSSRQTFKKASRNNADSSADEFEDGDMSGEDTSSKKSSKRKPSKRKVLSDDDDTTEEKEDEQEEELEEGEEEEHPRKIAKLAAKTIGDLNERSEQRKSSSTAKTTPAKPTSALSTPIKPSPKLAVDSQKSSSSKIKTDSNFSEPVVTKTTAEHDAKKSSPAPKGLQEKSTEATTFAPPSPIPSPKAVRVVSSISESAQKSLDTHGILIQSESNLNDVVQFDTIPTSLIQVKPGAEYRVTVHLDHPNFLPRIQQIIKDFKLNQSLTAFLEIRERATDTKAIETDKIYQDNPNGSTLHAIPRFSRIIKMPLPSSENEYWLILRLSGVHALLGTLFRIQLRITQFYSTQK